MDTKNLFIFIDLARDLHFLRTSEKHNMSASTLSRVIQRIEVEAGVTLFERNNRYVGLTEAGELYLQFAQQTLSLWQQFKKCSGGSQAELRGTLSLYCSVTASHSLLSSILAKLHRNQPEIEIKLHTGDQAVSLERLKQRHEDFVIAARPDKLDAQIAFKPLSVSELVFIGPSGSCSVREQLQQMQLKGSLNLVSLPWVVAEKGLARSRLNQWFRQQRAKPNIYAQVTGHEAIVSMVGLGCGVGLVPKLVLTNSPIFDSIEILNVDEVGRGKALADFEIGLCVLESRTKEPLINAVWSTVSH